MTWSELTEQPPQAQALQEPDPREILFEGTFEEVNRLFLENGYGRTADRAADNGQGAGVSGFYRQRRGEVIGRLLPDNRAATAGNVAVNGVIAGCRPEYMPISSPWPKRWRICAMGWSIAAIRRGLRH